MTDNIFYIDTTDNSLHTAPQDGLVSFVVPTQQKEDWKYTSFRKMLQPALQPKKDFTTPLIAEWKHDSFITLIIKDGQLSCDYPDNIDIKVCVLHNEGASSLPELLLNNAIKIAFSGESCKLRIVHTLSPQTSLVNSSLEFVVNKNQELVILEDYALPDEMVYFSNTKIDIHRDARVHHHVLQDIPSQTNLFTRLDVQVRDSARYNHNIVTLQGNMIRNESETVLDGEHAEVNLYGAYILQGRTHVDNRTKVHHLSPHSQSNELYRGILQDASTGIFNGRIFVHQDAQKTQAYQSNKNILLSDEAQVNTQPQLEIFADDVKCSHGATSAQIEDSELFYLRSRGIHKDTAKAFLVYAFAEEALNNIQMDIYKEFLDKKIADHLNLPYL